MAVLGSSVEVVATPLVIRREAQQFASRDYQPSLAGDLADFSGELAVFVVARVHRRRGAHWSEKGLQAEILKSYASVINPHAGDYTRFERAGMSKDSFNARKSHINAALIGKLGRRLAEPYLVETARSAVGCFSAQRV